MDECARESNTGCAAKEEFCFQTLPLRAAMITGSPRPRYTIFGAVVLVVVFLIVAYQTVIVTEPSFSQFLRTELITNSNERSGSNESKNNKNGVATAGQSPEANKATATPKKIANPMDNAPYWPIFANTSKVAGKPFKVDKWLVNTEACRIVNHNPRDQTLKDIIEDNQEPFQCPSNTVSGLPNVTGGLVYIQDGVLRVNEDVKRQVLEHYQANETNFRCTVEYMKRFPVEADDWINRIPDKAKEFTSETKILDEFMKIQCYVNTTAVIYETYDFAVIRKSDIESRCSSIQELQRSKGTYCEDQLSVLLMGVDSLSRMTSMRHLPRTRRVLQKMGGIEFLGYNKIGANTFPNMFAFLTGKLPKDLENQCWNNDVVFDNCTFLWDIFAAAGYRTAFVENMEYFGLFTYAKKGFLRQPADYYGRVFFQGASNLLRPFVNACLRNVSEDEAVFQWGVEFQKEFVHDRHFGYFWVSLFSHDDFNDIQQVDPFLSAQLDTLRMDKLLNNTLLIVMGDHGPRYGGLMDTDIGKYESNLPPMFLVFPKWFQKKYPVEMRNLRVNARNRMVTHLDLHMTLRDIINCRVAGLPGSESMEPQRHQAVSLFRPISERRTCFDAGVDEKYCGCDKNEITLPATSDLSLLMSELVVDRLNNLTEPKREMCVVLTLNGTDEVRARLNGNKLKLGLKDDTTFVVTLNTSPGEGKFTAYIYYTGAEGRFKIDDEISRVNAYGNSSACIKDSPTLLPICLCLDQV